MTSASKMRKAATGHIWGCSGDHQPALANTVGDACWRSKEGEQPVGHVGLAPKGSPGWATRQCHSSSRGQISKYKVSLRDTASLSHWRRPIFGDSP